MSVITTRNRKIFCIISVLFFSTNLFSFNFLVNLIYSFLPTPVKMAFKGEGLHTDQFEYGFGNCNFTSLGYLNSDIHYKAGSVIDDKFSFSVPTIYIYGNYVAHVSTAIARFIYPGWELSSEIGWGGVGYEPLVKQNYRQFFFSGCSGFNWKFFDVKNEKFGFTFNISSGYKLHYILKDLLYYGIQVGFIFSPKCSLNIEMTNTYKGGNFFLFIRDSFNSISKEENYTLSFNIILSRKFLFKLSGLYKKWYLKEYTIPQTEQNLNIYGIVLSLVSR